VFGVIVGTFNTETSDKTQGFLLNTVFLENTKSHSIVQAVNDSLMILWPNGIKYDKVLVLITDAANNMKCVGRILCKIYQKMTHITCLAHALHNVCEFLVIKFSKVNRLISCGKKVFKKSPNRVAKFRDMCPEIPLPPEPVITRWGSWLMAVEYYTKYFDKFSEVIQHFDGEESVFIEELQELVNNFNLKNDLAFIYANFDCLRKAINNLESSDLTLCSGVDIIQSIYGRLSISSDDISKAVFNKLNQVLDKNIGFKRIKLIYDILKGNNNVELDIELSPQEVALLKTCPLTNCDIERSFSNYKQILSERRMSFEDENLKKYFVIQFNAKKLMF
jgi:hypothetical protein